MRTRLRIVIVWLAAAFVLAGSAYGFAKTGSSSHSGPKSVSSATPAPEPDESPDVESESGRSPNANGAPSDHERKQNHGFFVSAAAHCENVDDPATGETFTAPADCDSNGKAHGDYLSSVARSSAGKPDKPPAH